MDPGTLWAAVGAIGTCAGVAATVFLARSTKKRAKYLRLEGRWVGGFNDQWDFTCEIQIRDTRASGRFCWKLVECSPGLQWAKHVGRQGYELVEGTMEQGILTCSGTKVTDADANLITMAHYTIPLPSHDGRFEGKSVPQKRSKWDVDGKLLGTVSYLKKAPDYFQE
jgi:hypothetical protein